MNFLKNIFGKQLESSKEEISTNNLDSDNEFGVFSIKDFPIEDQNKTFYFHEYNKQDGHFVKEGEQICKIRIGEHFGYKFKSGSVISPKSGILEWTMQKDQILTEKMIFYKIHERGDYENENLPENVEFKHYFDSTNRSTFGQWLKPDGSFVEKGDEIYQFNCNGNKQIQYAEKKGFLHIIDICKMITLSQNELLYVIRDSDIERINKIYVNVPNIIIDEFNNSKTIEWHSVSSRLPITSGIISKSDNGIIDLSFSFNYIQANDYLIFHFNPKQIQPKQNDKISFLFNNGNQIEFVLSNNPIAIKNRLNEKVLEYKSLITKSELDLFSNLDLKKWKISLNNDEREILGGEIGGEINYQSKNNLSIVIKKFANDYIEIVKANILDYKPLDVRQKIESNEIRVDFCFVYLMQAHLDGHWV